MRTPKPDTHEDKIALARNMAVQKAPYFATLIYGFIYVALEHSGTMLCTPKMVVGYDPEWAMEASTEELAADIAHEVNHFMRRHFERAGLVEDPRLFNLAGDLAINPDLRNAGWEIAGEKSKRPAVFPKQYDFPEGLSTEEYYAKLLQKKKEQSGIGDLGGKQGLPQPNQQGSGSPQQSPQEKGTICAGHCGGMAGGVDDPRLEAKLDADEGRSEVEIKLMTKQTVAAIKAHVEAKGRGSVPGGLLEFANALIEETPIRWQSELAHVIRQASGRIQSGGEDFSMSRPSKRSYVRGITRPGMIEHQPEVGIVRDSSGSMTLEMLNVCIREAYHIVSALGVDEVWFTDADADVACPWKRVNMNFFRTLTEVHGRGGTSFIPAIREAGKLFPRPDLLIYCTDGDGAAPRKAPQDMAVVWCLIPRGLHEHPRSPARWGHTVIVSEDPTKRRTPALEAYNDDGGEGDE